MYEKIYLNASKLVKMCRVCFTQSSSVMYDLTEYMDVDNRHILILAALEKIVSAEVLLNEELPKYICPMCISILKMSYKLVIQFEDTQEKLSKETGICPTYEPFTQNQFSDLLKTEKKEVEDAPVEIIFGDQKYNLNDVLIVENTEKEEGTFKGFLENLGQEVSATFIDQKSKIKTMADKQNDLSIYMALNENVLPVKELKIDPDTNTIDCIILEEPTQKVEEEENESFEYINIDISEGNFTESLIEDETNEKNKENERAIKRARKKSITETTIDGMIVMGPGNNKQEDGPKLVDDDDFEIEMQFRCDVCGKTYATNKGLKGHVRRTHRPSTRLFTCDICGQHNKTRSGLVHHKLQHRGRQFPCKICNKTYYTRAVLKIHMVSHTNNRSHLCSVCGKGFNYHNALQYHMRLHTGERKYICDICGRKFRMPNSLKRHRLTHTGEREYVCSFCGKAFFSKSEMQCHEHIHTGFRPYHCKHCGKGFTKTHNLKVHLLTHEGPHRCDICWKGFIEVGILAMHNKIAHKELLEKEEEEDEEELA